MGKSIKFEFSFVMEKKDGFDALVDGYKGFLNKRNIARPTHREFMARWVRDFLVFSGNNDAHSFDQNLHLFLDSLEKNPRISEWQTRQAEEAVKIYQHQYLAEKPHKENEPPPNACIDDPAMLDRLREVIRLRHYSKSTEKTYLHWNRQFLDYRKQTGAAEKPQLEDVRAFLTRLAVTDKVSTSTQNQALCAILLLFREVLHAELGDISKSIRARKKKKLPTVLSVNEVKILLDAVEPKYRLMAKLLYGSGLRLMELLRLRVKDLDFDAGLVIVRGGKGDKDRTTLLPDSLHHDLREHLKEVY